MPEEILKTINRARLKKLAAEGRLEMVESYHYDDMYGGERTGNERVLPVVYPRPEDWHDRPDGKLYLGDFDFSTKTGRAWMNSNGTVTLIVHSNCNYTFRIKPK